MEIFEKHLSQITGYKPCQCQCNECIKQCMKTPCLGTPDDILKLIDAGYKDYLNFTLWAVGMLTGHINYPIPMVQAIYNDRGCVFFRNSLCVLHDLGLKPTEGRFSYHSIPKTKQSLNDTLSWNIAMEWLDSKNILTILKIFKYMKE